MRTADTTRASAAPLYRGSARNWDAPMTAQQMADALVTMALLLTVAVLVAWSFRDAGAIRAKDIKIAQLERANVALKDALEQQTLATVVEAMERHPSLPPRMAVLKEAGR